ncbi:MAG: hypothetical protein ACR2J8_05205 [Thermomicrobiales bacterium]
MSAHVLRPVSVAGIALAGALIALTGQTQKVDAQYACDPSYGWTAGGCVPGYRDFDCWELHAMGIGDIPVIGYDWQRLDGFYDVQYGYWVSYPDGLGCEWLGE